MLVLAEENRCIECWFSVEDESVGSATVPGKNSVVVQVLHQHLVYLNGSALMKPRGTFSGDARTVELACKLLVHGGDPDDATSLLWSEVIVPQAFSSPPWEVFLPKTLEEWKEQVRRRNTAAVQDVIEA